MCFVRKSSTGFLLYRNGNLGTNDPPSYSTHYLFETWFDGTNSYNTVQIGNSRTTSNASSGNFGITSYAIASNRNTGDTGAGGFNGFISEIIVYNTALS